MMKNTPLWIVALRVLVSFITVSDTTQIVADGDNSGFISIDCGASRDYVDKVTGIWYQTDDEGFIESGTNHEIESRGIFSSEFNILQQLLTLRSFPEGERNCYTLKPKQDVKKYLIRATFAYGNYDFTNLVPVFDIYLGVNYWDTVQLPSANCFEHVEIIITQQYYRSSTETIQVCLINTGQGTPFINTLELRPLNYSLYPASLPLSMLRRADCGSRVITTSNRYKDDVYDRIWANDLRSIWGVLNTSEQGKVEGSAYELPSEILVSASQPLNHSNHTLTATWSFDAFGEYYLFLHFAEIQKLPSGQKRIINVTFYDENPFSQEFTLEYMKPVTLSYNKFTKGFVGFTVTTAAHLNTPPIVNAFEIYQVVLQPNSPTDPQDASAILDIKETYGISRISWQGDPCVPSCFTWEGLNCSNGNNIRIISLNLSSSQITGQITTLFAKLEKLESLDLSNNELTGQLPEFLATLPNLMFINVAGNKLTGSIPKALSEKANLQLSVANNPGLCQTNSCKEHKFFIPIIPSIGAFFIVIVIVSLVIWRFRKKKVSSAESQKTEVLKQKNQAYTYSEVLRITNNFETVIGEGGFGKVYLGILKDETRVAVKLLSSSSRQGYKEFQSEAQLLKIIQHRNLVSLVGFCDENGVKALIYEYMDHGDLSHLLSEKNSNILKWNERLQVAVDAAKGLLYLHNGCETPIIHRDLKPSNILLNNYMVAKISDFGLSRAFKSETDSHITTQPAGTPGYIDPEFQKTGYLNKKNDIYSFGMILLYLITSHPPIRRELESDCFIVDWINPKIECGDIQGIVDARLRGEFLVASAWKAVEIAMSCISLESTQRPNISCVLHQLKQCLAMEINHAKSKVMPTYPTNHTGQFEPITILSAR